MAEKTLSVKLTLNDKEFQSGLRKTSASLKKLGKSMQRTGRTLAMNFTVPILAAGAASVKMASDFEESLNKTRVAFGDSSAEVELFAKTTLKSFGLAEGSALEMSSLFGDMGTAMGLSQKEAANMSTSLVGLAGDLASFKNIGIEQAQIALAGIFTGETESLKKMGLLITESTLKQFGYNKSMTQTEKIAIRYKAILDQTINAQGDYIRTSDGVANSTRTLTESVKELSTEFGRELIPVTKRLLSFGTGIVEMLRATSDETKRSVVEYSALTAIIGPLLIFFGAIIKSAGTILKTFRKLSAIITVLWNGFKLLTPQGRIIGLVLLMLSQMNGLADSLANAFNKASDAVLRFAGLKDDLDLDPVVGTFEAIAPFVQTQKTPKTKGRAKASVPASVSPIAAGPIKVIEPEQIVMMEALNVNFMSLRENMDEIFSNLEIGEQMFASFGSTLQQTFINAMQSTDGFFTSFLEGAKQALKALIAQIAAMSILTFLLGGTNLGAMMGTGSIGGMQGVQSLFGVGGFAKSMGTSGSSGVEIFGTLSGADILLSNQRAGNSRNRTSGY